MKDLLRIASLLDNYEQFRLSDKLFKIAQQQQKPKATISDIYDTLNSNTIEEFTNNLKKFSEIYNHSNLKTAMDQYANAGATLAGIPINQNFILKKFYIQYGSMDVSELDTYIENLHDDYKTAQENQKLNTTDDRENVEDFAPSSKNDAQWQADKGTYQRFMLMNTNTPENFIKSLFEFSKQNKINNLVQAFDAYANAGASYNGNLINRDPVLKELYMRVRNTPRMIPEQELVNEIKMLSNPQKSNTKSAEEQNQETADNYSEFLSLVQAEPLNGLETLKTEIENNQYLTEQQKTALYNMIDTRLTKRK